jgi:hypothetical protein
MENQKIETENQHTKKTHGITTNTANNEEQTTTNNPNYLTYLAGSPLPFRR